MSNFRKVVKILIPLPIRNIIRKTYFYVFKWPYFKCKYYFLKPFAFLYKKLRSNKIYLFSERTFDAGDNAFYLYKYFKEKNCKCYFLITKSSSDIKKFNDKKDIIEPYSLKHLFYIQSVDYLLFEHLTYNPHCISYNKIPAKKIFLQHGIIQRIVTQYMIDMDFDLFITSTVAERQFIIDITKSNQNKVVLTGLARFDDVYNSSVKNSKIILIMPTFRKWLLDKETILASDYFKKWSSLLHNKELKDYCEKNNYQIIFYPHPEIRKYIGQEFYNLTDQQKDWNVHDLLINCSMVVTDYSSIAFDVAYQMKPVLYYQFDQNEFFGNHYTRGYYDEGNRIGYLFKDEEPLVKKIIQLTKFGIDKEMENKIKSFFYKIDNKNCERTYNEVTKI